MNFNDLQDKQVFITGANRGIGKAIADEFLKVGSKVIALYKETKPELSGKVIYVKANINDIIKIKKWLSQYEKKNKIDILINNAGIYPETDLLKVTSKEWDHLMDTNLKSTFFLTQLFAQHMKKNNSGIIINAGSFASKFPSAYTGLYAASKAAIDILTRTMAAEWAPYNIRVNAYSPGVIKTDMTKPKRIKNPKMVETISQNRFGDPVEVAKVVIFLASDASSYITGTCLDINGGKFIVQNPETPWKRLN